MTRVVERHARTAQEADVITKRNEQESAFLRIPGEIRNQIYAYAFDGASNDWEEELSDQFLGYRVPRSAELCLLTVSRQIHAETRLLPTIQAQRITNSARESQDLCE